MNVPWSETVNSSSSPSPERERPLDPVAVERVLARIPGVHASRVELGAGRRVQKVHAVITAERDAKRIVRDIESLLYTLFRLPVDYRKISVVRLGEDGTVQPERRVRLIAAAIDHDPEPAIRVTLRHAGRTGVGVGRLPAPLAEAVAEAEAQIARLEAIAEVAAGLRGVAAQLEAALPDELESSDEGLAALPAHAGGAGLDAPVTPPTNPLQAAGAGARPALQAFESGIDALEAVGGLVEGLRADLAHVAEALLLRHLFPLGARATIEAVENLLGRATGAAPVAAHVATLANDRAVVITLDLPEAGRSRRVVGCALLTDPAEPLDALCRATLDGLNRHLALALPVED